jgi:hypothetical protein
MDEKVTQDADDGRPGATPAERAEAFRAAVDVNAKREAEAKESARREALETRFRTLAPPVGAFAYDALDLMVNRANGKARPIATPWRGLNDAIGGGFWPGLHVLTGTTGAGKTQWALQVVLGAADAGVPVLYVGLELGHADLVARLLSLRLSDLASRSPERAAKVPRWSDLYLGTEAARSTLLSLSASPVFHGLAALPIHLEIAKARGGWFAQMLVDRVEGLRALYPESSRGGRPVLVVLDYLQIVSQDPHADRAQDLRSRIGDAAYVGRMVAREFDAAVLMLSSVSRENAKPLGEQADPPLGEGDPGRLVGLAKESGDVEYACDSVLALGKRCYDDQAGHAEMALAVAKLRAGGTSWVPLYFNGGRFWEPDSVRFSRRGNL